MKGNNTSSCLPLIRTTRKGRECRRLRHRCAFFPARGAPSSSTNERAETIVRVSCCSMAGIWWMVFGQHRQEEEIIERIVEETIFPFCFFVQKSMPFWMSWGCVKTVDFGYVFPAQKNFNGLHEPGSRSARETKHFPTARCASVFANPYPTRSKRLSKKRTAADIISSIKKKHTTRNRFQ
jgi:hypothetical protein